VKKSTSLIEIIKTVTLKHLADTDSQKEVDLPVFTKDLQAKIIINIALGKGLEETKFPYENADGSIEQLNMSRHQEKVFKDLIGKIINPLGMVLPSTRKWFITPYDRRLVRNVNAHREAIRSIIRERKSGRSGTFFDG
jgi:hypothetical protein